MKRKQGEEVKEMDEMMKRLEEIEKRLDELEEQIQKQIDSMTVGESNGNDMKPGTIRVLGIHSEKELHEFAERIIEKMKKDREIGTRPY